MSSSTGESLADGPASDSPVPASDAQHQHGRRAKQARPPGEKRSLAFVFLAPALILLAAILLYPLIYSIIRSLFSDTPSGGFGSFVWFRNYGEIFTDDSTLRAVQNNIIWLVVAPTLVTILGLIFAVLSERIRWATVFKTVLFMPMAISFLASGITFELIYADQPSRGLANAVTVGIHDIFSESSPYPGVHPRDADAMPGSAAKGYTTAKSFAAGSTALVPMTGLDLQTPPAEAEQARQATGAAGLHGTVWNDFQLGGGGTIGRIDSGELGLAGMTIQAVQHGDVVATTTADAHGRFAFSGLSNGQYRLRLPHSNFAEPFDGVSWLGKNLITPAIIIAYLWIYAGFAMVLLAAGMASIPRDTLEAARIDGATEWQVFRRITAPLLSPVLLVVFVTLMINVLKVFDIVFVIQQGAGASGKYADVLAVSLYNAFGTLHFGLASAIGVLLVLLVVPAIVANIRRFRRDQQ